MELDKLREENETLRTELQANKSAIETLRHEIQAMQAPPATAAMEVDPQVQTLQQELTALRQERILPPYHGGLRSE